ncbi:MAG: energy transducer TonB [Colwelliaceae bacterium]|nr:energy transducer TonB [Colwelliaceae bacterium]
MPTSTRLNNVGRYGISFALSIAVTIVLLWSMQALIAGGNDVLTEAPRGNVLDFIRLKKEQAIVKKDRKPQKPQKPKQPPPQLQQPQLQQANPNANAVSNSFTAQVDAVSGLTGGISLGSSDGDYLPIVKVAPIYPRRAQSRGLEGYVIVEFTVTKNGSVRDPIVLEAKPEGVFDRAAMDAALKFKYKPRIVDGTPTAVSGVQNKISFEIDG